MAINLIAQTDGFFVAPGRTAENESVDMSVAQQSDKQCLKLSWAGHVLSINIDDIFELLAIEEVLPSDRYEEVLKRLNGEI